MQDRDEAVKDDPQVKPIEDAEPSKNPDLHNPAAAKERVRRRHDSRSRTGIEYGMTVETGYGDSGKVHQKGRGSSK